MIITFPVGLTETLVKGEVIIQNRDDSLTKQLPSALLDSLKSASIPSFLMSGLRVGQQLMGLIVFGSQKDITLKTAHQHQLRLLADQIAMTYENRELLRRTDVSLMETQLLYTISNELVQTQDFALMLKVLFQYFGDGADSAGLVEIEYDSSGQVQEAHLRYQLRSNDDEITTPEQPLTEYAPIEEIRKLHQAWSAIDFPIYFIENSSDAKVDLPLQTFATQNIASCILIPLKENDRITHFISINWVQPRKFDEQTRRLLKSVHSQLEIIYENQRLLMDTQISSSYLSEQVQFQRMLNHLATFTSNNQDENLLLKLGAETLLNVLKVDHVGIMVIDADRQFADLATDVPERETSIRRVPIEGDLWETLARGEHKAIENVQDMKKAPTAANRQSLEALQIQSAIFLPFIDLSGQLMGSVQLGKFSGTMALSDEQLQTARLINAQLVSQWQNLRLLKSSQRYAEQMQQFAKFGETVQGKAELKDILQTAIDFAMRSLDINYVNVMLYDSDLRQLIVKAYHIDGQDNILPSGNISMPIENSVSGTVWKVGEPNYVRDLTQNSYINPLAKGCPCLICCRTHFTTRSARGD